MLLLSIYLIAHKKDTTAAMIQRIDLTVPFPRIEKITGSFVARLIF